MVKKTHFPEKVAWPPATYDVISRNWEYCFSPTPGWDACPSQGYPQQYVASTHLYMYTWVKGQGEISWLRKKYDGMDWASNHQPSDLKSDALTTTPPFPHFQ